MGKECGGPFKVFHWFTSYKSPRLELESEVCGQWVGGSWFNRFLFKKIKTKTKPLDVSLHSSINVKVVPGFPCLSQQGSPDVWVGTSARDPGFTPVCACSLGQGPP